MSVNLDKVLPYVSKPLKYQGLEFNITKKNKEHIDVTLALCFPETYEIGMSNLGSHILYHIINSVPNFLAERSYAPWVDMEEKMREENIPLFTLESHEPVKKFDVIGFTLQYELTYTNILNMLDLARIPIYANDRTEDDPIVIAGGPCSPNPEPVAPFMDAVLIGDGEEAILEICQLIHQAKQEGWDRYRTLKELSNISGVYVPSLYHYTDGVVAPKSEETKSKIKRRFIKELKTKDFPYPPVVPIGEIVHDRFMVEVMRGCTRGCRFCHAGIYYRPVRERDASEIVAMAEKGIKKSGWNELSLVSLSTADYSMIEPLTKELVRRFSPKNVSLSLPSLRLDSFSVELAGDVQTTKATALTFAPEAGTQRMRDVINKCLTNEDFERTINIAFAKGTKGVKLYFMIGLPTETIEDIQGIVQMIKTTSNIARNYGRSKSVNVTISPFTPKAHTPFQWEEKVTQEKLQEKIDYILAHVKSKNVDLKWHDLNTSVLEGIMARGDKNVSQVIYTAWKLGCRFDGWHEHFKNELWQQAFQESDIDPNDYLQAIPLDAPLLWDHIDILATKDFLRRERDKAYQGVTTGDCREGDCWGCGVSPGGNARKLADTTHRLEGSSDDEYGRGRTRRIVQRSQGNALHCRIKLRIGEKYRNMSHLDFIRMMTRVLSKSRIPVAFSEGFSPKPRISFGPPLPVGFAGLNEYFDLQLKHPSTSILRELNANFPEGIFAQEERRIFSHTKALSAVINTAQYTISDVSEFNQESIQQLLDREEIIVERHGKKGIKTVNIRPLIHKILLLEEEQKLEMTLALGSQGNVRPTEVLEVLCQISPCHREIKSFEINRTNLFVITPEGMLSPMDVV